MKNKNAEPPRPYYIKPSKNVVLRMLNVIIKPLRVDESGVTYELLVTNPPKSSASKQVIDQ